MKKIISLSAIILVTLIMSGCGKATKPNIAEQGGLVPAPENTTATPVQPVVPSEADVIPQTQPVTISIQNFAFSPSSVTVAKGTRVTWINNDSVPHQIKGDSFDSPSLAQGESWYYVSNQAGTFNYYCSIHPSMKGSVTIR
jgi:plastocyanin